MIPLILISFVGGIIYFVWMIVTACRRRWKRFGYQFAAAVAYVVFLYVAQLLSSHYEEARYFRNIFAVSGRFSEPTFSYYSERAFNGDGYSIAVFPLPKDVRDRFAAFDGKAMAEFPKRPDYRSHWKSSPWRKTPMEASEKKCLDFALAGAWSEETGKQQKVVRELSTKTGSYVAYFYYDHGDHPGDIDFFLVDLDGDRLYVINFNT